MLVKIEAFPDNGGKVSKTIHACLATSKNNKNDDNNDNDGIIFSLGRKVGDVVFPADKSVSRQHCVLRVVGELDGCMKPRNEQERKACKANGHGMCLVLETLGKGGSFVAVENKVAKGTSDAADDSETDDGGDDEDEETDEEGISQPPRAKVDDSADDTPEISTATKKFWGSKAAVKLVKIGAGDTHILNFTTKRKTICVQHGRFESTLQITWIPLKLTFSRAAKNNSLSGLREKLHWTGAWNAESDTPDPTTTYLVTPELMGGAKQLIAWAMGVPIVSPEYLQAFLDRASPDDSLPSPDDFPVGKTDDLEFWDTRADRNLLSRYTLLSLEFTELEILAGAAGAKVLQLYNLENEKAALKKAQTGLQDSGTICFALASPRTGRSLLKKLSSMGVATVSGKRLASAVSRQNRELKDTRGRLVTKREVDDVTLQEGDGYVGSASGQSGLATRSTRSDETRTVQSTPATATSKPRASQRNHREAEAEPEPQDVVSIPESKLETQSPDRSRKRQERSNSSTKRSPEISPKKVNSYDNSVDVTGDIDVGGDIDGCHDDDDDYNDNKEEDAMDVSLQNTEDQRDKEEEEDVDDDNQDEDENLPSLDLKLCSDRVKAIIKRFKDNPPPKRRPKPKLFGSAPRNGWYSTAPKDDRKRREIRDEAKRNYVPDNDDVQFLQSANTEVIAVASPGPRKRRPHDPVSFRSRKNGPNFKRFRKNHVTKSDLRVPIALTKVLPNESDYRKEMHEKQLKWEEEQRKVDELFRGEAVAARKRRRR